METLQSYIRTTQRLKNTSQLFLLIFIQFVSFQISNAQKGYQNETALNNNVKIKLTYILMKNAVQVDSILLSKEVFNVKGYPLSKTIYKNGKSTLYNYEYLNDSIQTQRITLFNDSAYITTKITYGKDEKICIDYDVKGKKTGIYSIEKYDKKGRKKAFKLFHDKKILVHEVYKYYRNGQLKKKKSVLEKEKIIEYNREGKIISDYKGSMEKVSQMEVEDIDGTTLISISNKYYQKTRTLGIAGELEINKGDILQVETFYDSNGLPLYATENINGKLVSKIYNKYIIRYQE